MKATPKTKEQLIQELEVLRRRNAALEKSETERKRAEAALRESENNYRNLFENASEAIFVVQDGKIVFLNPMVTVMSGYSVEELTTMPLTEFIHPADRDMVINRYLRRLNGEILPQIYPYRVIRKDGNIRWGEVNVVLISWKEKIATLNFMVDITERKRTEEAIKISEKNLRLLSNRLIHAQEDERKRIAYELHDELGQSLVGLKFQLSGLQKKSAGAPNDLTQEFTQALQAINGVTENVRRLSRELRPSVLEHLGLMEALEWLFEDFTKKYPIKIRNFIKEIKKTFSKEKGIIIFRIFQEALANIGKHAKATQVTISMIDEGESTVFSIRDNGKGFNPKAVKGKGLLKTGLGLIALQERVLMTGGTIEIKSEPRKGPLITFAIQGRRTKKK